jgi:hypothetical protein
MIAKGFDLGATRQDQWEAIDYDTLRGMLRGRDLLGVHRDLKLDCYIGEEQAKKKKVSV